jgi:hypothetical protein
MPCYGTFGSIAILFSTISAGLLYRLLNVTKQMIDQVLKNLHAILDIPKVETSPFCLLHPSFRDYPSAMTDAKTQTSA